MSKNVDSDSDVANIKGNSLIDCRQQSINSIGLNVGVHDCAQKAQTIEFNEMGLDCAPTHGGT